MQVAAPETAPEAPATATPSTPPDQVQAASQPACELLYTAIADHIGLCGAEAGRIKDLYHAGTGLYVGKLHSFMSSEHGNTSYFHNGTILETASERGEQSKFVVVPGSLISVSEGGNLAASLRTKRQELRASGKLTEVTSDDGSKHYLQIQRGSVVEFSSLQHAAAFIKGYRPRADVEACRASPWTPPQGGITPVTPSPAQAPRRYQPSPSGGDPLNRALAGDAY